SRRRARSGSMASSSMSSPGLVPPRRRATAGGSIVATTVVLTAGPAPRCPLAVQSVEYLAQASVASLSALGAGQPLGIFAAMRKGQPVERGLCCRVVGEGSREVGRNGKRTGPIVSLDLHNHVVTNVDGRCLTGGFVHAEANLPEPAGIVELSNSTPLIAPSTRNRLPPPSAVSTASGSRTKAPPPWAAS